MAGNFIKGGMVKVVSDNKVVIDNNEIIKKKLEELKSKMVEMEDESEDENALDEFSEGINPVQVAMLVSDDEDGNSNEPLTDALFEPGINAAKIEDINESKNLMEQAMAEAEEIKMAAKEEGYNTGHEEGYNAGYTEGLNKGRADLEAQLNSEYNQKLSELEQEFATKEAELNDLFNSQINNIEPILVDKIMDVIKHVTGIELAGNKEIIITILKTALENMDNGKHYLIHVSSEDYENVKQNKAEISKGTGILEDSFEIIEDNSVPVNGALIESDAGIFDCGLGSQLELLKKQLMLISYE